MGNLKEPVSVIIPAYNIDSALLSRCVESACCQSYENLEIIIVDDGSDKEHACEIDNLFSHDQMIRIVHKENCGVSSARNAALSIAQGSYILFLDSDDYLYSEFAISEAVDLIESFSADIVFGQVVIEYPYHNARFLEHYDMDTPLVISDESEIKKLAWFFLSYGIPKDASFPKNLRRGIASRLFSRKLIDGLLFNERVSYGEDSLFDYQAVAKARKVVIVDDPWYVYCQYQNSAIRTITFDEVASQADELLSLSKEDRWLYAERISNLFIRACTKEVRNNKEGVKEFGFAVANELLSQALNSRKPEFFLEPRWKKILMNLSRKKRFRTLYLIVKAACFASDRFFPEVKQR